MHNQNQKALNALLALAMAFGYMLIFAYNNTPLGAAVGSDNAMYLTMGTALARGCAPYVDVFDHKGPLLFILQGLPQAVGGGYNLTAVFLQETTALFACLLVVYALAKKLSCPPIAAQLAYLALTCAFMDGGNLTEEYTNLPTLLALYMALCVFGQAQIPQKLFAPAVVMGICTAAAFMLRANNALPLFTLISVLAAGLLVKRRFAQLGQCAAGFTLGLLLVFLPILLWLAAKGALSAAWYGAILHNMMYAESGSGSRFAALFVTAYGHMATAIAALSCVGALIVFKKRRAPLLACAMLAAAAAGGLAAFLSRKFYIHYLMLGIPLAAVGFAALLGLADRPRIKRAAVSATALICALWLGINGHAANQTRLSERADWAQFTADAQTLMAQVPQDERDRFMAYRVEPRWYVAAEALPCMRFYFLQEVLAQADPAVMDEIVQTFENDPPRWLVIYYNRAFNPPYDARVAAIFETNYEFVDAAGQYQLLRLKEGLPCEPNS